MGGLGGRAGVGDGQADHHVWTAWRLLLRVDVAPSVYNRDKDSPNSLRYLCIVASKQAKREELTEKLAKRKRAHYYNNCRNKSRLSSQRKITLPEHGISTSPHSSSVRDVRYMKRVRL